MVIWGGGGLVFFGGVPLLVCDYWVAEKVCWQRSTRCRLVRLKFVNRHGNRRGVGGVLDGEGVFAAVLEKVTGKREFWAHGKGCSSMNSCGGCWKMLKVPPKLVEEWALPVLSNWIMMGFLSLGLLWPTESKFNGLGSSISLTEHQEPCSWGRLGGEWLLVTASRPDRWYENTTGSLFSFFACSKNHHGFLCPAAFFKDLSLPCWPFCKRLLEVSEKLAPTRWANVQGDGDWNGFAGETPRWSFVESRFRALRRLQAIFEQFFQGACYVICVFLKSRRATVIAVMFVSCLPFSTPSEMTN